MASEVGCDFCCKQESHPTSLSISIVYGDVSVGLVAKLEAPASVVGLQAAGNGLKGTLREGSGTCSSQA